MRKKKVASLNVCLCKRRQQGTSVFSEATLWLSPVQGCVCFTCQRLPLGCTNSSPLHVCLIQTSRLPAPVTLLLPVRPSASSSRPTPCLDRSLLRRRTCGTVQSGALYTAANRDKVRLMWSVVSRSAQVGLGGRVTAINQFPVWQTRTGRSEVTDNPILLKYH